MKKYFDLINDKELLTIFANAVKIPSINPPGKEKKMCEYVENLLKTNDIEYEKVMVEQDRYDIVARIRGKSNENSIIFTGHMDVVPVSDEEMKRWSYEPFSATIKEGFLYGRGSSDMKSGLISAIYAMIVLKRNNIIPSNDIILVATIDEENYMKGSKALLNSKLISDAKYLVVCEPTDLKICNKGKGRTWADVYVKGKTAHGSQAGVGENAIYLAIRLIEKIKNTNFDEYSSDENGSSFWRTLAINAGVEPQVVPDKCTFTVDARLSVGHETSEVWQKLDELIQEVKSEVPDFDASYEIIDERHSWHTSEENNLIRLVKKGLDSINEKCELDIFAGSTDASVLIKNSLIPVIIGPGDLSVVHRENECIKIEQLYKACRLYMSMMITGII